jgi:hypothetical protein
VPNLQDNLTVMLDQLERCQKALSEFLEEKRARFPRFYFIGDDDLLEILGQAKNPRVIQSHLKKLFAGAQDRNTARRFVARRFFRFKNVTISCQDRLGTNIVRKNSRGNKTRVFCLSCAGIHSVEFTDDSANLTAMCGNRRRFWRRCTH